MNGQVIRAVVFEVAGEEYGVDVLSLDEILPMVEIKPFPKAPSFIEGVVCLRGETILTVDLRSQFGLEKGEDTAETRIILASFSARRLGFIVDKAKMVLNIQKAKVQSSGIRPSESGFVEGFVEVEEGKVIRLINLSRVLDESSLAKIKKVHEEVF